jgi:hypothetical protein
MKQDINGLLEKIESMEIEKKPVYLDITVNEFYFDEALKLLGKYGTIDFDSWNREHIYLCAENSDKARELVRYLHDKSSGVVHVYVGNMSLHQY